VKQPTTRTRISCLGARQLLDHALPGPLPLLQEDQEIGHPCPSGLSWSCRMTSARTSLGRSGPEGDPRRAAGPSASARRAASSQHTGARAYQRPGRQASCGTSSSTALEVESEGHRAVTLVEGSGCNTLWCRVFVNVAGAKAAPTGPTCLSPQPRRGGATDRARP
jgi:hypothetical protein